MVLLFFWGLSLTNASNASLIMTITPIFVLVLSAWFLKEKLNSSKWIGILIGFSGAILLGKNTFLNSGTETLLGDFMIFINAFLYGLYLVLVKPLAQKYHPITLFKWISLYGLIFITPFCIRDFTSENWLSLPTDIWLLILYVCVAATFFTYLLNAFALKMANASLVGIYIYVQPVVATIIAISIGQEVFDLSKLFIAIYIFLGVYLVSKKTVGN
jgi:drug/metabolite transporter (DMT)-like permease